MNVDTRVRLEAYIDRLCVMRAALILRGAAAAQRGASTQALELESQAQRLADDIARVTEFISLAQFDPHAEFAPRWPSAFR